MEKKKLSRICCILQNHLGTLKKNKDNRHGIYSTLFFEFFHNLVLWSNAYPARCKLFRNALYDADLQFGSKLRTSTSDGTYKPPSTCLMLPRLTAMCSFSIKSIAFVQGTVLRSNFLNPKNNDRWGKLHFVSPPILLCTLHRTYDRTEAAVHAYAVEKYHSKLHMFCHRLLT